MKFILIAPNLGPIEDIENSLGLVFYRSILF